MVDGDPKDPATEFPLALASEEHFTQGDRLSCDEASRSRRLDPHGRPGRGLERQPDDHRRRAGDAPGRAARRSSAPSSSRTRFDTEAEAIAAANNTRYGLNAMVFTENLSTAHRVAARLRAGTVWVNCFFIRDLRAPFGGVGDSGVGREGGNFSREFFTEPKAVVMQIDNG